MDRNRFHCLKPHQIVFQDFCSWMPSKRPNLRFLRTMILYVWSDVTMTTVLYLISVEWSCFEDFSPLAGEQIIEDPHYTFYEIPGLTQGSVYYCRVKAWNIKGFGPSAISSPACAVPSSKSHTGCPLVFLGAVNVLISVQSLDIQNNVAWKCLFMQK